MKKSLSSPYAIQNKLERNSFNQVRNSKKSQKGIDKSKSNYLNFTLLNEERETSEEKKEEFGNKCDLSNDEEHPKFGIIGSLKKVNPINKSKENLKLIPQNNQQDLENTIQLFQNSKVSPQKQVVISDIEKDKKSKQIYYSQRTSNINLVRNSIKRSSISNSKKSRKKQFGFSRLSTVKKEAELKVKKYFTTNVKPDLEVKLNQIKYELYEIIKQESKENAQKNLIEILKNQQDFESKSSIILNDCNSRTKEIEENVLSDVLGYYKKSKRAESDKVYEWKNLEEKVNLYHEEIGVNEECVKSISSVILLICESLTIQLNTSQHRELQVNETEGQEQENGLQTERMNSRNEHKNDLNYKLDKTHEL